MKNFRDSMKTVHDIMGKKSLTKADHQAVLDTLETIQKTLGDTWTL